jgi:deoxyguanosine kinase
VIVAIEGCIGSGKSTTARMLADHLSCGVLLEHTADHPFLAEFYLEPSQNALETELGFVLLHYHRLKAAQADQRLVTDFSPGKDLVFGKMNLQGADFELFDHVYRALTNRLNKPSVAIYLDLPLELLMERIRKRGRPYEQGIPGSYLEGLRESYFANLSELAQTVRVVRVQAGDSVQTVFRKVLDAAERDITDKR